MATTYWIGKAENVKQISTVQVTAFDVTTTYTITIGGETVSVLGDTDADTTASNLQVALEASTIIYFSTIDWTVATDTITATAGTAGIPFTATSSVNGGTGTIGAVTTTTASSGSNDWGTAANFSGGAVPVSTDSVIIRDGSSNIFWGLDQNAVDLALLRVHNSYTGKIGLDRGKFTTGSDPEAVDSSKDEYRSHYLKIGSDRIDLGYNDNASTPAGSTRIKIDNDITTASVMVVYSTASVASETGLPAVRLLASDADVDLFVRSALGGVGVGVDEGDETPTIGNVTVTDSTGSSRVIIGAGATLSNFTQLGGNNFLNALTAVTLTAVNVDGGTLTTEGGFAITTVTVDSGTFNSNNGDGGGVKIATANVNGGTLDGTGSSEARTWTTINLGTGGTLKLDPAVITVTTLNDPTEPYSISVIAV